MSEFSHDADDDATDDDTRAMTFFENTELIIFNDDVNIL